MRMNSHKRRRRLLLVIPGLALVLMAFLVFPSMWKPATVAPYPTPVNPNDVTMTPLPLLLIDPGHGGGDGKD